jgi:hypothetical protein
VSPAIQTEKDDLKEQLSRIFEGPELREHRVCPSAVYSYTRRTRGLFYVLSSLVRSPGRLHARWRVWTQSPLLIRKRQRQVVEDRGLGCHRGKRLSVLPDRKASRPCVLPPVGFGGGCSDGLDWLPPWRRALHANLQPRHSRRGPRTFAMARRRRGTYITVVFFLCLPVPTTKKPALSSGTFSATIRFSLEKSRRVLLPQVKPSKSLFRHLRPYPVSLRRWKCPSLLVRPWTCPIEIRRNCCRWEFSLSVGAATVIIPLETSLVNARIVILFVILLYSTFVTNRTAYCTDTDVPPFDLWGHQPCPSSLP